MLQRRRLLYHKEESWQAASFGLFTTGAMFPVASFFWLDSFAAVALSGGLLVLIGAETSPFTGRNFAASALRQLLVGYAAGGHLRHRHPVGVSLAG